MAVGWAIGVALAAVTANPQSGMPEAKRDALARYGAGVWQARTGRLLTAARSLDAAAKLDPAATPAPRELVTLYQNLGRENEAVRAARTVLAADPADIDTAHTLAKLLHDAGDPVGAAAALAPAADHPELPKRPDRAVAVWKDLARLRDAAGDPGGAADPLRRAVALLTERRAAVVASGKVTAAEADAEAADALEKLGRVLVKAKAFADAAAAFEKARPLSADPSAAARLDWNLAKLHAARGDKAAALDRLGPVLRRKPRGVEPYELFASLHRDPVPRLRALLRADPDNAPLEAVLAAELARDPASRAEADTRFDAVARVAPDPAVVRVVVRSHVETGRAGKVLADLDRAYKGADVGEPKRAAERVRPVVELLRGEQGWADAVLRRGAVDLAAGVEHSHQTWHVMALLADRHRRLDFAADLYRRIADRHERGSEAEAYSRLFDVLWRANRPAEVAAAARDALQTAKSTQPWFLNYHLGRALADTGDAAEAVARIDDAITQGPGGNRLGLRLGKATVLERVGRWGDAVSLCRALPDEFPEPGERSRIRYALAGALWGAGKRAEAEAELRGLLDDDPDHAGALNDLGYHLADMGRDLGEAERLVRRAVELDRADRHRAGDPEAYNAAYLDSLGWVLFRKGDLPAARDWLLKAADLPTGAADPTVWDHLGDVRFRLGDKDGAAAAWRAAEAVYATDGRGDRDGRRAEVRAKLKRVP